MKMNLRYLIVIAIIIILGVFIFLDKSQLENEQSSLFYYGKRNFDLNKTQVYEMDIGFLENKHLFDINGFPKKIIFKQNSFYFLEATGNEKRLKQRKLSGEEAILINGDIQEDFIVSASGNLVAYQELKDFVDKKKVLDEGEGGESYIKESKYLEIHYYDLLNKEDETLFSLDPISDGIVFTTFSKDDKKLYFDEIKEGIHIQGKVNIFDLNEKKIVHAWESPVQYGTRTSPVLVPDESGYMLLTQDVQESEGVSDYLNYLIYIDFSTGSEQVLHKTISKSPVQLFSTPLIFDNKVYYSVEIDNVFNTFVVNLEDKSKKDLNIKGVVTGKLSESKIITKTHADGFNIFSSVDKGSGEVKELIREKSAFYIGMIEN